MRRKLLQKDIAQGLGISPAMVTRLKARGMPTHSVSAAAEWRRSNLDPALVKGVRMTRPAAVGEPGRQGPDQLEIVRQLGALAAIDPAPWLAELRLALAAVPAARRDEVELSIEVWDALLAHVLPLLDKCEDELRAAGVAGLDEQTPEDEEFASRWLYHLACGEAVYSGG